MMSSAALPDCHCTGHRTKNTRLNLRLSLRRRCCNRARMDDGPEIFDEANSVLQTLLSAQAEEVTKLLATTVKGETGPPAMLCRSLITL